MNRRTRLAKPRPDLWPRWAACLLALAAPALAAPEPAHAQAFPEIPTCGQCPPIADDPARICDGKFRWGFNYDPDTRVPDLPSGTPLRDLIAPVDHGFELWIFLGAAGLASPASCTPQTCLYQAIPRNRFRQVRDGAFVYKDPTAALGAARFVSGIHIRRRTDGSMHVTVRALVATPLDGKISLVLSQLGNQVSSGGATVVEPTVSFGIDMRHQPWSATSCGLMLHDTGGSAPQLFCAPPLVSQCATPPTVTCAKRRCPAAAKVRRPGGARPATVELHVAVSPSSPLSLAAQPLTLTLQKTNSPAASVDVARLAPGRMQGAGHRYRFRGANLRVGAVERSDGLLAIDIVAKVSLPPLGEQDSLIATLSLGPDSFSIPAAPRQWSTDGNGSLVVRAGPGSLPLCPLER